MDTVLRKKKKLQRLIRWRDKELKEKFKTTHIIIIIIIIIKIIITTYYDYIMYFLFSSISDIFLDNCAVLEGYIHEWICRGMYHD